MVVHHPGRALFGANWIVPYSSTEKLGWVSHELCARLNRFLVNKMRLIPGVQVGVNSFFYLRLAEEPPQL
jgi:hypothetical protein